MSIFPKEVDKPAVYEGFTVENCRIKIKKTTKLKDDEQIILNLVKENSGKKIGEIFDHYKEKGGEGVNKTFQRKITFLSKNKFISTKKQLGGVEGNTTLVNYERETKLDEY